MAIRWWEADPNISAKWACESIRIIASIEDNLLEPKLLCFYNSIGVIKFDLALADGLVVALTALCGCVELEELPQNIPRMHSFLAVNCLRLTCGCSNYNWHCRNCNWYWWIYRCRQAYDRRSWLNQWRCWCTFIDSREWINL